MQQHTKIALQSRRYPITGEPVPCDVEGCWKPAQDTHHIENSYRGKRKNNKYNLSLLCRDCHNKYGHSGNTVESRILLIERVKWILDNIEERKEQARKFNYYV
ncbi:MAG TPA: HNH endonuclease [Candidatus Absconditabacterales bacterium]|nr:HNH endonuclease [Candidatus Absconditabacterales bacterium]